MKTRESDPTPMLETYQCTAVDGYIVCRPEGELDAATVSGFRQGIADLPMPQRVVIDLSQVCFIDSAGLGALIGAIRRIREQGGSVVVACERPTLLRILRTTGFDRIVVVAGSVDSAAACMDDLVAHASAV